MEPTDYRMLQSSITNGHAWFGHTLHKTIVRITIIACIAGIDQVEVAKVGLPNRFISQIRRQKNTKNFWCTVVAAITCKLCAIL